MFTAMTGVRMIHVPYKGGSPQYTIDLITGRIELAFASMAPVIPHVKSGRLKVLGTSADKRDPQFPEVPTISESGLPGFNVTSYLILIAAAGTSPDIVRQINAEVNEIWAQPASQKILADLYLDWQKQTPEELTAFLAAETERWTKLIKEAKIKVE